MDVWMDIYSLLLESLNARTGEMWVVNCECLSVGNKENRSLCYTIVEARDRRLYEDMGESVIDVACVIMKVA